MAGTALEDSVHIMPALATDSRPTTCFVLFRTIYFCSSRLHALVLVETRISREIIIEVDSSSSGWHRQNKKRYSSQFTLCSALIKQDALYEMRRMGFQ